MVSNLGANGSDDSRNSGVVLKFVNLKAMVRDREILVNVSGLVKPGEVLAVMGSSGKNTVTLYHIVFLFACSLVYLFSDLFLSNVQQKVENTRQLAIRRLGRVKGSRYVGEFQPS